MSKTIEYFVAPQSPWTYFGNARLVAIAKKHNAQIALKPTDMVKVFAASGGVPVAQRPPQRQAYRLAELARWRDFLGMPLNLHPAFFPVSPSRWRRGRDGHAGCAGSCLLGGRKKYR
jgi:2-hydroxychromene-2-carboxylate isomerase